MCKLIYQFIKSGNGNGGYGYFAGDRNAIKFAEKISLSQIRKFKRHGVIPADFLRYLENIEAIERKKFVPEKHRTIYWLLDLLWETPHRNQANRSEGECIRVEILKDMMPWISNKMGTAEHIWRSAEFYNTRLETTQTKDCGQRASFAPRILRKREGEVV